MRSNPAPDGIVLTGPTATGKSQLAVEICERLGGEIISADSRQVYRGMDIGTAKPTAASRDRVPHHGLDRIPPDHSYSAGRFASDAEAWINAIRVRGAVPVVVGGTGLFIRALLTPLAPEPQSEGDRRERLRRHLVARPLDRLKAWLRRLDPARAEQLSVEGGPQRIARSLEVILLSGRSHSWWLRRTPELPALSNPLVFCLQIEREELYGRIDARFDRMMAEGLLEEVKGLVDSYPEGAPGLKSVGYTELIGHLRGELTLEEAVEQAKHSTRQYARRQLSWFRHQLPADTVWLDALRASRDLVRDVGRRWEEALQSGTGSERRVNLLSDE